MDFHLSSLTFFFSSIGYLRRWDELVYLSYFPISLIIGVLKKSSPYAFLSTFCAFFTTNLLWLIATKTSDFSHSYTSFLAPFEFLQVFSFFFFYFSFALAWNAKKKSCKKVAKAFTAFLFRVKTFFFASLLT